MSDIQETRRELALAREYHTFLKALYAEFARGATYARIAVVLDIPEDLIHRLVLQAHDLMGQ